MRVKIDVDEWYPVFSISDDKPTAAHGVEVSDQTIERWRRVGREFDEVQKELREASGYDNPVVRHNTDGSVTTIYSGVQCTT